MKQISSHHKSFFQVQLYEGHWFCRQRRVMWDEKEKINSSHSRLFLLTTSLHAIHTFSLVTTQQANSPNTRNLGYLILIPSTYP